MITWLVIAPLALLLLAALGANWRAFHLAYVKHRLTSSDADTCRGALDSLVEVHLRAGMTREEVARTVRPLALTPGHGGECIQVEYSSRNESGYSGVVLIFEEGIYRGWEVGFGGRSTRGRWPGNSAAPESPPG
jgi:hypothetical protein